MAAIKEVNIQCALDQNSKSYVNYDPTINTKKVVHQQAHVKSFSEPTTTLNGQILKYDNAFTFPGRAPSQSSAH